MTITLKWDESGDGTPVSAYIVKELLPDDSVREVGRPVVTTLTLLNVSSGFHRYFVTAMTEYGESFPSNLVSTAGVLGKPRNLTIDITI